MKERPILFSGAMVRAILNGTKTQTRRVVDVDRVQKRGVRDSAGWRPFNLNDGADRQSVADNAGGVCPYGAAGDRLWVRETWAQWDGGQHARRVGGGVSFRADCIDKTGREIDPRARLDFGVRWRPSIHMPRWASRLTLDVTSVRVERLQDISEDDARAEGVTPVEGGGGALYPSKHAARRDGTHRDAFAALWDSLGGASWAANPWVWVVTFSRVQP